MAEPTRKELLALYKRGPLALKKALAGLTAKDLDAHPIKGEWSVREIVCHLADGEQISAVRLRRLLVEDSPLLPGYDAAAYAKKARYDKIPLPVALAAFEVARGMSFAVLSNISPADWKRAGTHSEYGPYSVERWLQANANHVMNHIKQIMEVREAMGKGPKPTAAKKAAVKKAATAKAAATPAAKAKAKAAVAKKVATAKKAAKKK
ncbi:MAG: DinB family protein [Chloroflexota bacterium]